MNQKELQEKISQVSNNLAKKRSLIITEFRKKLEEKGIISLRNRLDQK